MTPTVPVLIYHGLTSGAEAVDVRLDKYWVRDEMFRTQLGLLWSGGHRSALLGDLWNGATASARARSSVVLTFDDGRASDYESVFPLLLEAGARAEFFVNTATVGQPGHLDWGRMREMQRAGMSFQSHGHHHVAMLGLAERQIEWQLVTSKARLEDGLGVRVDFVAAPYGLASRRIVDVALRVGYRGVCTSRHWPARPGAAVINRAAIHRGTTPRHFARLLRRERDAYLAELLRGVLTWAPKRLLLRTGRLPVETMESPA